MTMELGAPTTTIAWLIQTDPPSCPVEAQHPARLLTCTRPPAQTALAAPQPCSNVAELHHPRQLRQQLPGRSQGPGKHQALMEAPSLGVLLSGQDMLPGHSFQGLSPHLRLAGDYPPPPPCPSSPCHCYSSSPSSTRPDAHSGPACQACGLTHVRQDQSTRTHGLVPPLTPPRRLAFSLLSN